MMSVKLSGCLPDADLGDGEYKFFNQELVQGGFDMVGFGTDIVRACFRDLAFELTKGSNSSLRQNRENSTVSEGAPGNNVH
jgi:hypothetical protein